MTRVDQRARLSAKRAYKTAFGGPASVLENTNGILFPYTPNISVAHTAEYAQYDLVHTNYQQQAFSRSRNPTIQITGTFINQTPREAKYTIGVMHFLRVVSKMHYGINDDDAGTPPPVLDFSAYGTYNFYKVPVLVSSFNFIYEDGVDYIETVTSDGETVQIPTLMTIAIDLLPQYNPTKQSNFSLYDFANGDGYKGGFI